MFFFIVWSGICFLAHTECIIGWISAANFDKIKSLSFIVFILNWYRNKSVRVKLFNDYLTSTFTKGIFKDVAELYTPVVYVDKVKASELLIFNDLLVFKRIDEMKIVFMYNKCSYV